MVYNKNIIVQLEDNRGYKWFSLNDKLFVKGFLFDQEDVLYSDDELLNYFENIENEDNFKEKLQNANGLFSVILFKEDTVLFAVDRLRTFPLFYQTLQNKIIIKDVNEIDLQRIDYDSLKVFKGFGFVTGEKTLIENVNQVQSGEYISFNPSTLDYSSNFYFSYSIDKNLNKEESELCLIFDRIARRLIKFSAGRKIVLPLSGGYDSRIIAVLLKKYKYENVLCYTYGNVNSHEVKLSEKIAKKLGYQWEFVEYRNEIIKGFTTKETFLSFFKTSSKSVSIPHIQDFFAVEKLSEFLPKDSIFVPGHSGDFLGGSHLDLKMVERKLEKEDILEFINKKHFRFNKQDYKKFNLEKFLRFKFNKVLNYSDYENWNLKERQSKFIVNSVRVYESFGFKFLLPLWDYELIDYFKDLNVYEKINNKTYNKVLFDNYFEQYFVGYKKQETLSFLKFIKSKIPNNVKRFLKKKGKKSAKLDFNNFNSIIEEIEPYSGKHLNEVLISYYLKENGIYESKTI